jgi:hypothetical protein
MKLVTLSMAVAAACIFVQTAQARGNHHHRYGYRYHASRHALSERYLEQSGYASEDAAGQNWQQWLSGSSDQWRRSARAERSEHSGNADAGFSERRRFFRHRRTARYAERADDRGGYGALPSPWCGWEMRHLVGADPGPHYNLARNWAHWGHSGPAGVGAVVVWAHHVGKIVGRDGDGQWVIRSGNDGHRVRTRSRSIGGAIAIRWS